MQHFNCKYLIIKSLVSSILWLPGAAWAQAPVGPAATTVALTECVKVIKGDSMALYYDKSYVLTPIACASVCRLTRIDPQGNFDGEVRDYTGPGNKLRYRQHYRHGQREGAYESFYLNGQPAIRGAFTQGQPAGTWVFWYANGQKQQELEWLSPSEPRLRIVAYWDSTGQQLVTAGNGRWSGIMPDLHRQVSGPVVNGLANGIWESRDPATKQLLTTEVYQNGVFKNGKALDGKYPGPYKDQALLRPRLSDPTGPAEQFKVGTSCAARLASYQQNMALRNMVLVPPKPPGDGNTYLSRLMTKLSEQNQMLQNILRDDAYRATIEADITELGVLTGFEGTDPFIRGVFANTVPALGNWSAATANGQAVPGRATFEISVYSNQLQVRAHWNIKQPLPAKMLTTSK
ncbi:toxin-antitoxin system YwqK family antitoxin [Hymenobacter baengnokdamensis]|uniref:toxin-antitoxin system YwqK family antitoxin n=1 Tax=Hymenobacter baengnokdamensis TaxID=2615203 RepID=UPI001246BA3B|nr:hypothetical protein [Hymenobacter baengnokdamensis]